MKRAGREITRRVRDEVAGIGDLRERRVTTLLGSVQEIRANPATAAWFEPGVSGLAARMSQSAEGVERFVAPALLRDRQG